MVFISYSDIQKTSKKQNVLLLFLIQIFNNQLKKKKRINQQTNFGFYFYSDIQKTNKKQNLLLLVLIQIFNNQIRNKKLCFYFLFRY